MFETARVNSLKLFKSPVKEMNTEELLNITKNAIIILELEDIKKEYFSANWNRRDDILNKLYKFSNHKNF